MRDAHYTEPAIARVLANCIDSTPANVADFACGNGSLLEAAAARWPTCKTFGVDIDPSVEAALKMRASDVRFLAVDFLSSQMASADIVGAFDAILLNPPFSCRGSHTETVTLAGTSLKCSRAMAFIVHSLRYLANEGTLAALVPTSCLFSDKDSTAREALARLYHLRVLSPTTPPQFQGCSVSTAVLVLYKRDLPNLTAANEATCANNASFEVLRGARPNSTGTESAAFGPFVHTTELSRNRINFERSATPHSRDREVIGPAIIMPRVGRPLEDKLCFLGENEKIRISDCIVAIKHRETALIHLTYKAMRSDWEILKEQYQGTCAPYVTLGRLTSYLSTLSIEFDDVPAAA